MGATAAFMRDDATLAVFDSGQGLPVLFQHGLGGDEAQVAQTFPMGKARRITVECRGHGASSLGDIRPFSFRMFAEDVLAAATDRGFDRFIVGGISMGAAIALYLAHHYPDRVAALILVRPAWTFAAAPANLEPVRLVAALLRSYSIAEAKEHFAACEIGMRICANAPDNFASLLGYFDRPNAGAFASVLADIAADGTGITQAEAAALTVPTLIIGNEQDVIHPLACARTLADTIADTRFVEITPKAADKAQHFAEVQDAIATFLASKTIRSLFPS
ncbi:alpha/beta fold hydrolase [Rhizobium leucaenae]|uniref:Pimeloyl-ACP methyl ester carboxylesterase n=1 Tax=Rhizobium leucaenae TaxID=29450 RepID=A0A7W6ZY34_9HYPH|nr:alpha/beta hydrolase [Rhizobium leucaenae]MBB4570893.1 pimeloyl-ACP methyl ester carboxylesterase [Rhizobium leucaenae]MBB6303555.1 pimeloyl-ACP methyl ester carboxylesterase [Rhizobium leucaenae]